MSGFTTKKYSIFILFLFVCLVIASWLVSKPIMASWPNVPSAPEQDKGSFLALGDKQLAYRQNAFFLQNLGYGLAEDLSLKDYNYKHLKKWFFLQDSLDSVSDATPMLAAYYYGAVPDSQNISHVVEYLAHVGQSPIKEKWRWLARAVFLARYEMEDLDKALELSYVLANNKNPNIADWAQQMPAFILAEKGQDKAAYQIMINILASRHDKLHPSEVYFMKDYICNKLVPNIDDMLPPEMCDSL